MSATEREQRLAETFVELADTLVADFDVIEFLGVLAARCVELLGVAAAGLVLADQGGALRVVAASDERARLLELFEVQNAEGPCRDCLRLGAAVLNADLGASAARWPRFAPRAVGQGFRSVSALPLRLRAQVVGSLSLLAAEAPGLAGPQLRLGQALADAATIGIVQHPAIRDGEVAAAQLQAALTSRVVIEQARGVLAERLQISSDEAFGVLRTAAASRGAVLSEVARQVMAGAAGTAGAADLARLLGPSPAELGQA